MVFLPTAALAPVASSGAPPLATEPASAPKPTTGRLLALDVAKGISILLVVLGHSRILHGPTKANLVLGTIRMPLFFFVAGLFFKHRKALGRLVHEKADALLKPFFVTLGVVGLFKVFLMGVPAATYYAMLAYGNGKTIEWIPMWFLPHLWVVFTFSWLLVKATRFESRSTLVRGIILSSLLVVGTITIRLFWRSHLQILGRTHELPGLPFTLDVVPLTSFFFLLGFWFQDRVRSMTFRARWFWPVLAVFVALHVFFNDSIDFNTRRYDNVVISTVAAFCGVYLVLSMAALMSRSLSVARSIAYVGSMSLFVLIFHYPLQAKAHLLLDAWLGDHVMLNTPLAYLAGVGAPLLIGMIIQRNRFLRSLYLPAQRRPALAVAAASAPAAVVRWGGLRVAKSYVERSAPHE